MAVWKYDGFLKDGKRTVGSINATSQKEVKRQLRVLGIRPKKITPPSILEFDIGEWMIDNGLSAPFGTKELLNFTKQLSIMTGAGVPILQTLEIIYKSEKHPLMKKTVKQIARDVGEGQTIAEALTKHKGFNKLYVNLVKAGETGGILDTILDKLAEHMDKSEKTKAKIKSALSYPVVVMLIGFAVIWALMVFVVPQFVGMLTDTGQEIPGITQFVINISDFLGEYSLYGVPIIIVSGVIFKSFINTDSGKVAWDYFTMRIPMFGPLIVKGNLTTFCRTLATMLGAGVSLIDSLEICIETVENSKVAADLKQVKKDVIQGKTLTEPLLKIDYFPDMVSQMIKVGEQTGNIDTMLDKVSEVFEDEVNQLIDGLTKLIEPLIIVGLGGTIAMIMVAIYLPMFMAGGGAE